MLGRTGWKVTDQSESDRTGLRHTGASSEKGDVDNASRREDGLLKQSRWFLKREPADI